MQQSKELEAGWGVLFRRLTALAERSDPAIWNAIGNMYQNGHGTEINFSKAMHWFRKAAQSGDARSMASLGFAYLFGKGVKRDPQQAMEWYIQAAEAGDHRSMIRIGGLYAHRFNLPGEGLKWFLRAAENGHTESYLSLAALYDDRSSPVYDPVEAVKWLLMAVEVPDGRNEQAMLALADHYRNGSGVARDLKAAMKWVHRLLSILPERSTRHREASNLLKEMQGGLL